MPPARALAARDHRPTPRLLGARVLGCALVALSLGCTQEREPPRNDWMETEVTPPARPTPTMTEPIRTPDGAIPIEEVAKYPLPGTSTPGSFPWP